jgi:glycerol-3-phosphate dehydrogenase
MTPAPARMSLSTLADRYDLVIVGGGVTGAGILREAVRSSRSVLLVEARDFASGTSSASSKLVHGGLRYLKEGQWRLTLESVRERERLLREAPGLVEAQAFLMPIRRGVKPGRWLMQFGLLLYDLMAGSLRSSWLPRERLLAVVPELSPDGLLGAVRYEDARTDDARLVLRLILEARAAGALALNYVHATLTQQDGRVDGVTLRDGIDGAERHIRAGTVINATGAWAGALVGAPDGAPTLRPLRGSHLLFSQQHLPLTEAVSWLHPRDQRPVFAYPWEGVTVYGTTDLDHRGPLEAVGATAAEVAYLMEALQQQFPQLQLQAGDALSSYSGVRAVVSSGTSAKPSSESRESAMWTSAGLVGITGGKLTTFRVTAREVLRAVARELPQFAPGDDAPVFAETPAPVSQQRLHGRLGSAAVRLLAETPAQELALIEGTPYCWAELRWAARHEQVVQLQDLMMRRTRLGLVSPRGGAELLPRIAEICEAELGWGPARWAAEAQEYLEYWQAHHAPPGA